MGLRAACGCTILVYYMNEAQYPIQLVARLTGLSAQVMRIWENLAQPGATLDGWRKPARKAKQ